MKRRLREELQQRKPFASLEEEVWLELQRTSSVAARWVTEALRPSGLSPSQFNVLRILRGARPERLACGTIGERMVAHDPDLTRLLDRLQAAGLVDKSRDERDRRAMLVSITRKGLDVVERASRAVEERLQGALGGLGARKLEALADLLELVRGAEADGPSSATWTRSPETISTQEEQHMETGKDLILVTGATGRQGGATARELLAKGHKVRAMTRHPESPAGRELAKLGAQVVAGDLDDAASLERALAGAWGVFGVQNTWEAGVEREEEQGHRLAKLARKAGVQHYVYASVASAQRRTGIPHFENKWRIEDTVRGLGFPSHVILRPVFFMENFLLPSFLGPIQQGQLAVALEPKTVLQMIAVRDIGRYGLQAFEKHAQLNRREIDMAGDQLTMPQAAEVLGRAVGHALKFVRVPIAEIRKFSEDYAIMLEWFDRVGYDVDIPKTAAEFGIRPTTLAEWAPTASWAQVPAAG
jgi:uncharacterized protein YbjT (DUF2867 family)/DNA-binding MarR family transcriptional regulator